MNIRRCQCPNCHAPCEADDRSCGYCYAHIPAGEGESENAQLICGGMFAIVLGLLAIDWYFGGHAFNFITHICNQLSAAM